MKINYKKILVLLVVLVLLAACAPKAPATEQVVEEKTAEEASVDENEMIDQGVELTWVDGGGSYHDAVVAAWLDDYQEKTGVEFSYVGWTDNALLVAQVESGAVTYSVFNGDNTWGLDAHSEWLEPIDYSIVSKEGIIEGMATEYRVPNMMYSVLLAYNTDKTGGKVPEGWVDFFDLEKIPGKRCVMDYSVGGIFEIALMADGVPTDELYPLDLERAAAKLDTIKDELIFWGTGAEGEDLIASGEATMCMEYNARAIDAKEVLGKPVELQWNQQMLAAAYLTVPKGTPNKDAAMRLIAYMVSAENNGKLSDHFGVAPINMNSKMDPASAENQPGAHLDQEYIIFDDAWIVANQETVEAFYQEWKAK